MASSPFGFGAPLTGKRIPADLEMPDGLPVSGGLGSPKVDAFLALQGQRIKDAILAPSRALSGELPIYDPETGHTTDAAREAAGGLAGLAMTGSLPFSAPTGALRMFGGRNAKTADLAALGRAEGMATQGADRRAIWDQTGWFQGADQKWRFEIPDDLSELGRASPHAPPEYGRLYHDDLADAYPEMWGRTQQSISPGPRSEGFYQREYDTIVARGPTDRAQRSVALHELQHAVQAEEGFARGANPKAMANEPNADVIGAGLLKAYADQHGNGPLSELAEKARQKAMYDLYRRHAGEVEARNVQARRDMMPEELRATPPWETQDVPDAEQIVRFGFGGPQMSAAGSKSPRRLTYDSPLRGQERVSKVGAEREIAERQAQIDFATARGEPVQDALRGQIDALTALLPKFEVETFPRARPFEPARVVDAGDRFAVRVQERGGGDRMYRVLERREDGSLSRPIGSADMMQHPDGRWETSMLEVNPRHQGKGAASALYRAVEQDTGQARVPSGVLLPDGHAFWKARDPEQVAYHQFVDDRYLSPKRLMGGLESQDLSPEYRAKLQTALDAVPAAGKTPEALARQFSMAGLIGSGAAAGALAAPDTAAAAPSQGSPPMPAGLAAIDPADLVRLFGKAPLGAPQGFSGTSGAVVQPDEPAPQPLRVAPSAALPAPAGLAVPALPRPVIRQGEPLSPGFQVPDAPVPEADRPAPGAMPVMGRAPAGLAAPALAAPVSAAAPPTASPEEPSFGDRLASGTRDFRANGGFDYLGAIGAGLLSSPTWGGGLSAGMQLAQRGETQRAAGDLARTELALRQRKLAQETSAMGGNAAIIRRAYPNLSEAEAVAAGSNSAQVTEALKILRDPNHGTGLSRVTVGGNIYEMKPGERPSPANLIGPAEAGPDAIRQRAQAQAEGTAAGKPDDVYTPLSEQDRIARGYPAGSYQVDSKGKVSPINPTGTTINMGQEKAQDATVGKAYGEQRIDYATKGRNAASTLNTLAIMEQAMSAPGFYSGLGAEQVKQANSLLGSLGVVNPKAASGAEVFDALSNKVVLDGLGGSLGPGISNTDRDYIGRTAPTLERSAEGNRALIGIARSLAQRQQVIAKMARDYVAAHGGRLDEGFDQQVEDFAKQNPLFPSATAGATASAPNEPPQGAPAGARQAPDGKFYVPDPGRPGKFMQVQ